MSDHSITADGDLIAISGAGFDIGIECICILLYFIINILIKAVLVLFQSISPLLLFSFPFLGSGGKGVIESIHHLSSSQHSSNLTLDTWPACCVPSEQGQSHSQLLHAATEQSSHLFWEKFSDH